MQFIDLKAQYLALKPEIDASIQEVLNDAQFIMGDAVQSFEKELSEYTGVKNVISCANGTDALQMLYMAYEIGQGDAIFCPDITFIATVEPGCMLGATPIFCDVNPDDFNLSVQSLERQIKAVLEEGKLRPRAVVPVDFLGNAADYASILEIAKRYDMVVIEDAAQSIGGKGADRMCGAYGHASIASFFPAKPLGCYGDGGAILTNDNELAALCRSLRVHGKGATKYENVRIGMNSRLDTIQAAVLRVKLRALRDVEMARRQEIAARYANALGKDFQLLKIGKGHISAYAQYALLAMDTKMRDRITASLTEQGIPSMVYYPYPQHALDVFAGAPHYGETYANATDYCARTFSLPMHPYLDAVTQDQIITAVLEAIR